MKMKTFQIKEKHPLSIKLNSLWEFMENLRIKIEISQYGVFVTDDSLKDVDDQLILYELKDLDSKNTISLIPPVFEYFVTYNIAPVKVLPTDEEIYKKKVEEINLKISSYEKRKLNIKEELENTRSKLENVKLRYEQDIALASLTNENLDTEINSLKLELAGLENDKISKIDGDAFQSTKSNDE